MPFPTEFIAESAATFKELNGQFSDRLREFVNGFGIASGPQEFAEFDASVQAIMDDWMDAVTDFTTKTFVTLRGREINKTFTQVRKKNRNAIKPNKRAKLNIPITDLGARLEQIKQTVLDRQLWAMNTVGSLDGA